MANQKRKREKKNTHTYVCMYECMYVLICIYIKIEFLDFVKNHKISKY